MTDNLTNLFSPIPAPVITQPGPQMFIGAFLLLAVVGLALIIIGVIQWRKHRVKV